LKKYLVHFIGPTFFLYLQCCLFWFSASVFTRNSSYCCSAS